MSADEQRKLAAIMFTDMVGYSALSQRDEKLAQELLEEHREILRKIFPRFNGTEIKTIGDAFLVEFNSALEAAQCAIEIQRAIAHRNHDAPAERRIELKIGVHIGDVVHRGGDVYGDGVNIASRIEPLAGPGGVCISMDVERQIRNALEARFERLAATELKNISVPMDLFRIVLPWEAKPEIGGPAAAGKLQSEVRRDRVSSAGSRWIWAVVAGLLIAGLLGYQLRRSKASAPRQSEEVPKSKVGQLGEPSLPVNQKSIAVLPLVNTSGDPANEYFSDGLSEELIAVLAKIPDLKVIGRSSSFLFKGQTAGSKAIGEKLGVAHLIEGSVRKQGDRVRIIAELINAPDGRSLWSETYDRELKDVFAVQSEIARAVADQMKVKLLGEKAQSDAAPASQNLAAYNAVLQSDFYFQQLTPESLKRAIEFLEEAVRLDPNYAVAYAKLSQAWRQYAASFAAAEGSKAYDAARRAGDMAARLAPDLAEVRMALGFLALTPDLDFRAAEKEFRRVLEASPNHASAKNFLGATFSAQGRLTEAEQTYREVISLDPLRASAWFNMGRVFVGLRRYREAEEVFRKGLEVQPQATRFHTYLAMIDVDQGRLEKAMTNAQLETEGFWRDFAVTLVRQAQSDRAAADAALKDFIARDAEGGAFQIAVLYAVRRQPDEMFKWLDTAYETRDSGLTQMAVTPFFPRYFDDPRFVALCQKLNVKIPAVSPTPFTQP